MIESFSVRWKVYVNVYVKDGRVLKVEFSNRPTRDCISSETTERLRLDLIEYFEGCEVDFRKYEVLMNSSEFVRSVLNVVREIPYGVVKTYGEIAKMMRTSPRAVGRALKLNPSPIIVPCHRVVGANGIGGFSRGVWIKMELLKLELRDRIGSLGV